MSFRERVTKKVEQEVQELHQERLDRFAGWALSGLLHDVKHLHTPLTQREMKSITQCAAAIAIMMTMELNTVDA